MLWSGNYPTVQLNITKGQAQQGSHQGDCESDIQELMRIPAIARQLQKIDPTQLRKELREYGAWDDAALRDHGANLERILWLACGDINEGAW